MAEPARNCETLDLIARLQVVLTRADLACGCRELLTGALERFTDLETRRLSRRSLVRARDHKDRIAAILALFSELNQLTESEPDRTVFVEMALLFDEIGHSAAAAAGPCARSIRPSSPRRAKICRAPAIWCGCNSQIARL
jgi:hypothetical protein